MEGEGLRQKKKRDRRERIHDAALKLFSERGFQGTTISLIAREANLGTGTVYNYFRSKEEIIFSVIRDRSDEYSEDLDAILSKGDDDPVNSVSSFMEIYLNCFSFYNKTIWREMISAAFSKNIPVMTMIDEVDAVFLDKLSRLIAGFQKKGLTDKKISSGDTARTVYELMLHRILRYITDSGMSLSELKESLKTGIRIILPKD